ncbi:GmrSD restriction endonuclease domain-containing protein [Undibacterium sp. WLHG33]|uniref:GmrSD restriction endonuclease domain-containing protein n=1 Tax=Undibacterium sp. WLHG33 TaxID=3412482 RepID=UPI003C2AFB9C
MSYKPSSLFNLIQTVNKGLFLPHIQRPFVWEEDQMRKLFDSLMRNYPIQTLLFWKTKDEIKARKFMEEVEWDPDLSDFYEPNISKAGCEKVFVLDGQQRLQTLFATFAGAVKATDGSRAEAYFDVTGGDVLSDDGLLYAMKFSTSALPHPWYRIADLVGKDAQRNAEELADEMNDHLDTVEDALQAEQRPTAADQRSRQKRVRRNFGQLVSLLREDKHFWIQELDGVANNFSYATVLDIFVRVNSGGTKLDASDLMFAAMKEGWDEIEEAIEETTELLNSTNIGFDKTFPLKCLLVVHGRGAEASPEKFSGSGGAKLLAEMKDGWDRAEAAFQELRDFLKTDLKVYAEKVVRSHNSFIPLFDYLYFNPRPNERSRALMRGYYYKAQLFGWYSQGTDKVINGLHSAVGQACPGGFPMQEIKDYFVGRGYPTDLQKGHLEQTRLRFLLLNLVYVDQMGASPFDVKSKGNEPHIDHIYPRHALSTKLGLAGGEINTLGNYRFVGATDNIRKRAELPASYFGRLKAAGTPVEKHLLLDDFAADTDKLAFDVATYRDFRDRRAQRIWEICSRTVNPEMAVVKLGGGA